MKFYKVMTSSLQTNCKIYIQIIPYVSNHIKWSFRRTIMVHDDRLKFINVFLYLFWILFSHINEIENENGKHSNKNVGNKREYRWAIKIWTIQRNAGYTRQRQTKTKPTGHNYTEPNINNVNKTRSPHTNNWNNS